MSLGRQQTSLEDPQEHFTSAVACCEVKFREAEHMRAHAFRLDARHLTSDLPQLHDGTSHTTANPRAAHAHGWITRDAGPPFFGLVMLPPLPQPCSHSACGPENCCQAFIVNY